MHKLTKVTTEFSENSELATRKWANILSADADIAAIISKDYTIADLCYDKTDVTLTWADGKEMSFRLDASRRNTIVSTLASQYHYYNSKQPLVYMTPRQLGQARREWQDLVENYEI